MAASHLRNRIWALTVDKDDAVKKKNDNSLPSYEEKYGHFLYKSCPPLAYKNL